MFDITGIGYSISSSFQANQKISVINTALSQGKAVMASMYVRGGHIVRVQQIDQNGLRIDDPFGEILRLADREFEGTYKNGFDGNSKNLSTTGKGENVDITWSEINVSIDDNGKGGVVEIYENEILNPVSSQTFIKWLNGTWGYTKSEYPTEERTEPNPESPGTTIKKKYYKCFGASIKYYQVYSK